MKLIIYIHCKEGKFIFNKYSCNIMVSQCNIRSPLPIKNYTLQLRFFIISQFNATVSSTRFGPLPSSRCAMGNISFLIKYFTTNFVSMYLYFPSIQNIRGQNASKDVFVHGSSAAHSNGEG